MVRGLISESVSIYQRLMLRHLEHRFSSGLGDSCWVLYGLVKALKPKTVVEIGSARGKSACYIGLALRENGGGMLHAIDPHSPTDWNDLKSVDTFTFITKTVRLLGLGRWITIVRTTSVEAGTKWTAPIDVLFIDGDHSYEGAKKDFELFSPHLSEKGVCVFHDTTWNIDEELSGNRRADMGVPQLVDELRTDGYPVLTLPRDFGVSIIQRCKGGLPLV